MTTDSRYAAVPGLQLQSCPEVLPRYMLNSLLKFSSFFWLGLVSSLFIGLFITAIRTRNARLASNGAGSAPQRSGLTLVRPQLWEVNLSPDAVAGGRETTQVVERWEEMLVRHFHVQQCIMRDADTSFYAGT